MLSVILKQQKSSVSEFNSTCKIIILIPPIKCWIAYMGKSKFGVLHTMPRLLTSTRKRDAGVQDISSAFLRFSAEKRY